MTDLTRMPLDSDTASYVNAYRKVDAQIREWERMRDELARRIKDTLGESSEGTINGETVVRWTRYTQRRLSPSLLRKRFSDDELAEFYTETTARKFSIVDVP